MENLNHNSFTCEGECRMELHTDYQLRTKGYCYLCDPNITLKELLSDKPISKFCHLDNEGNFIDPAKVD